MRIECLSCGHIIDKAFQILGEQRIKVSTPNYRRKKINHEEKPPHPSINPALYVEFKYEDVETLIVSKCPECKICFYCKKAITRKEIKKKLVEKPIDPITESELVHTKCQEEAYTIHAGCGVDNYY
jgi:hypothetical protein